MGRHYDHLWHQIISFNNLWWAFKKAACGKRSKPTVADFEYDLEPNLIQLQEELKSGSYQPGQYVSFYVHEAKRRLVSAAPFRDRVVHHALINVIAPLFERKFIFDTYANRIGKGTHRALDRCTKFLRRYIFILPLDVRQYFPSIDHAILLDILGQTVADERTLELCQKIIVSGEGVLQDEYDPVYFPGDDMFAALRPRGLPIGNMTSQFWANVYLNGLDHFIKRKLKCEGYTRYVDDLLLFSNDKKILHVWRNEVIGYMASLRLTIHENNAQPRPCVNGVPYLGFQVCSDHRRLKRRNVIQARRRIKTLAGYYRKNEIELERLTASIQGWVNHARYGDTWGLRQDILGNLSLKWSPI